MTDQLSIQLEPDEALVLFEMLSVWQEKGLLTPPAQLFEHDSERAVLSASILCQLEKALVEPFKSNYGELLDGARSSVSARYPWLVD